MESELLFYENLRRSAGFDANMTYPSLFQHLGYRKLIAEQLLQEIDEQKKQELTELYEHVNSIIKKIIGL